MRIKPTIPLILLAASVCWGQSEYRIPLRDANPSLAIPLVAGGNGVLYVAYRSPTWLRHSNQLEVLAYDLNAHKELRHATISVPEVHGARAAEGLYLSADGQMLAYAEIHDPCLLLLISTKDLTELRRSTSLPFVHLDPGFPNGQRGEVFGGFDSQGWLSFAIPRGHSKGIRFVRVDPANLGVVSNDITENLWKDSSEGLLWSPVSKRIWMPKRDVRVHGWVEYTEEGKSTGEEFWGTTQETTYGADVLGKEKLIAYFGRWDHGSAISYHDHEAHALNLPCTLFQYGIGDDPEYAGALCLVTRERGGGWDKTESSEFLLLRTDTPSVIWREKTISLVDRSETDKDHYWYYQKGNPLIYRLSDKIYVVAPSKAPELNVYVVPVPE
jgi:hypothetical protein